ncbi:hypothetical protein KZX46_21095 (plasmid) [Polymorphobacter sp. PAMC 29334]|uniref:hypothetical protein n=1 Tax=Polymorphobacter sp. PAMC 29334 TaxID=2862331 RepID=UPI001C73FAB3|nr:hypothetical protein [Polymorphobacter sp. PAMC 29334]QYE37012.1 hypothetical protein KZX46_21095 [Polymorphobacter sp. PAMC 29334]
MGAKPNLIVAGTLAFLITSPSAAQMSPGPHEVQVGPVDVPQVIQTIPVVIKATSFMAVDTSPTGLTVQARMFANLGDLQAKIGSIVDTFPLPRDNCRSFSSNNPVVTIDTKSLGLSGNSLIFTVSGSVVVWDCRENPIPNSKLEWKNDGPFGLSIPHVVTWPGSPIKNKLLSQPISASIPITLSPLSDRSIKVTLGQPDVKLGGQPYLAAIRDMLLGLFKVSINNLASDAIKSAVDPAKLQATLPSDFDRLNPKITKASFIDVNGSPGAEIDADATIVAANLTDILKAIADKSATPPSKP